MINGVTTLSQAKILGGTGSILVLLSPLISLTALIPPLTFFVDVILSIGIASGMVGLIGSVMILVAVKMISDAVNDREIFKNVLMAVIIPLTALGIVVAVTLSVPLMYAGPIIVDGDYLAEGGYLGTDVILPTFPTLLDLPIITLMTLLGMWVALIVSAWFLKRGYEVLVSSVAAEGLGREWIGRRIDAESLEELLALSERRGFDPDGEGGDYETLVLWAPIFRRRIRITEWATTWDGYSGRLVLGGTVLD